MKAQVLYEFRERTEFCSGTDLQEFFLQEMGDPSPSGYREIQCRKASWFVKFSVAALIRNGTPMTEAMKILDLWHLVSIHED